MHIGSGENPRGRGLGFRREGHKGPMGDKGSQFTSNLGLRWTIPVTAGGSQVSKRGIQQGEYSKGKCAMYSCVSVTRVVYILE